MQDRNPPYQGIHAASRTTGLAQSYLRAGCRAGTIPYIRSGGKYYICVPELLEQLAAEARANGSGEAERIRGGGKDAS